MSKVQTLEKRVAPRLGVPTTDYLIHTGSSWRIRNLSVSGVFVEDQQPLPAGSPLYMELHLGHERIPCSGVVRRVIPRVGMGIQFREVSRDVQDRVERYLTCLAKSTAKAEAVVAPIPVAPGEGGGEAGTAGPEILRTGQEVASGTISARLEELSAGLRQVEDEIKAGEVEPRVLREFRDSVDQIRVTAWAVQQWTELEAQKGDPYSVLPLITRERIRRMAKLAEDLALDIDATEIEQGTEGIEQLHGAIERLHGRLARLFRQRR